MLQLVEVLAASLVLVVTLLPLLKMKAWWVRIWAFPRLQIAAIGALTLAALLVGPPGLPPALNGSLVVALAVAVAAQIAFVWRYSKLAPKEVHNSASGDQERRLSLTVSNVLQGNRDSRRLLAELKRADADIVLCLETDDWWRRQLDAMLRGHPHRLQQPRGNTYGMLLYSRLALLEARVEFLVEDDVPSFQAQVVLPNGERVWLNCVHPRPPVPGEADSSLPRDAELLLVGRRVRDADLPVIVCGDLNDVAWSRTTRRFQKISRLLDPRKGRGMFSTFHAKYPGLRVPLDHIFHSDSFRLVSLRRLGYVGSDHFPVHAVLSLEPDASEHQRAPEADREDLTHAGETIAQGLREHKGSETAGRGQRKHT